MNNARLAISKSVESMPRIISIWLLDITTKQHGNISFHGRMAKKIPQFFIINNDRMQWLLTMAHTQLDLCLLLMHDIQYLWRMMEFMHYQLRIVLNNSIHTKPIVIEQGNHSNGLKIIPINSNVIFLLIVDVKILVCLTIGTPFHIVVMTKLVPPKIRSDFSPPWGVIITFVQLVIPYSKPFRKPLKYHSYKKNNNLNVHVWIFKVAIKVNGETIDKKITNLFNFMLKDNTLD